MFRLVLTFLVALAATSQAAAPFCMAPGELTFHAYVSEWGKPFRARFFVEYDRSNQRVAMFGEERRGSVHRVQEFLYLHKEKVGYDVNFEAKTCKKFEVGKFHPFEVAPNSTYEGQFNVGGPGSTVTVLRWAKRLEDKREYFLQEFTFKRCYPVSTFLAEEKDFNKSVRTDIYDTVVGISDPNAFNVPELCQHTALGDMPDQARMAMSMYTRTFHN